MRSFTICNHSSQNITWLKQRWGHTVAYLVFIWPNSSSRTMALGSTQPLREMSTRNLPGEVKGGRRIRLVSILSRQNVGASTSHNPMGLHGLLQR
jgi:hypothetical protein